VGFAEKAPKDFFSSVKMMALCIFLEVLSIPLMGNEVTTIKPSVKISSLR